MNQTVGKLIIGLDLHPDVFAAAALSADGQCEHPDWVQDRLSTAGLEAWAKKQLSKEDVIVLEASGNSFEVATRLHALGHTAVVLESAQADKIRDNSVWHLLMGHYTPLLEITDHLRTQLLRLATLLGHAAIQSLGFANRDAFVDAQLKSIQLSP